MSEKSSNSKPKPLHRLKKRLKRTPEKRVYNWRMLILFPAWVIVAYVAANIIVAGVLLTLTFFHMPAESYIRPAVLQTVIATLIYTLTIAIIVLAPYIWQRKITITLEALGLGRLLSWTDIALAPVTFIVYTIVAAIVLNIVTTLIPLFPLDQTQDIGFKAFGSRSDNMLAFVTLVVLAPIAEETLFRGYLYGKLKKYVPTIVAAIATSALFGLAHFQWNVGLDVFVLSLFLCGLRSLTGSIWAGILVHMIKNGIAYYLLFISPMIGG